MVQCSACGQDLDCRPEVAAPLCPACTDSMFLQEGGAILALPREFPGARFPLGKITITPGAVGVLAEARQHAALFLARHVQGDWGKFGHCDHISLTPDEQRRGWEASDKINKCNLLEGRKTVVGDYFAGKRGDALGLQQFSRLGLSPAGPQNSFSRPWLQNTLMEVLV